MIGYPEVIVVLVLALLLFGPNKLPDLARSLGKATKEFKHAQNEFSKELTKIDRPLEYNKELKTLDNSSEDSDKKIFKLAADIGIDTNNKTVEQVTDEITLKIRSQSTK
jgi:sec-independent protein translocase protein TatA